MSTYFGVDYYPEHWPSSRWKRDIHLMKEMGIDLVRLAEFSWSKYEPREGVFQFEFLDEIIDMLSEHGIKVILGTPSAAPPAWLIKKHPEIQPIDYEGKMRYFGGRHHACQSNNILRNYIKKYVSVMAKHFTDNVNVIGWQIDNELGNSHHDLCFCDSCQNNFRLWLEEKYEDINNLNEKWGNVFWSQEYNNFEEITAPKITVTGHNPSAMLDWKLFCSDLIVDFHKFQSTIIRKYSNKPITHNFMGFANKVSYYDLAKDLEYVSHDQYPGLFHGNMPQQHPSALAGALDLMRSTKKQPFWIMEQQSGITGWEVMGRSPKPGQLSLWAAQTIAHGADCIVFFRWRNCIYGTEQYWHGVLPHSGIPGRNYSELKEFIHKYKPLMQDVKGSMPQNRVGIVFSYRQEYAFQIQPHHPDLKYTEQILKYYKSFYENNIPVDFLSEEDDFSKYDLIVAPLQYLMSDELEKKYCEYVNNGGNLILTMRSGVKDEFNICRTTGHLPCGELSKLLGIEILEYDCLREINGKIKWNEHDYNCEKWCDIITLTTADSIANYNFEFYKGNPGITLNNYGKGNAYYIGTEPSEELLSDLLQHITEKIGIEPILATNGGIEIVSRHANNNEYIFVLNHSNETLKINKKNHWRDYFSDQGDTVNPYDVLVYVNDNDV